MLVMKSTLLREVLFDLDAVLVHQGGAVLERVAVDPSQADQKCQAAGVTDELVALPGLLHPGEASAEGEVDAGSAVPGGDHVRRGEEPEVLAHRGCASTASRRFIASSACRCTSW